MAGSGGCRVDPHVKILDERVVDKAKAAGLDAIVYAPHFTRFSTAKRRAEQFSDEELLVVPAREIFTGTWRNRKHVHAFGLSDPVPDFITLAATMDELERQDAAVLAPHPEFLTLSLGRADIERYAECIDAIEVYNPKHWSWHNHRARTICDAMGKPAFASSYAHLRPTIGAAWVEFEESLDTVDAVVDAFKRGAPRTVGRRRGVAHELKAKVEFSHLAWENSWEKFDRVVLSEREPTNPFHSAYEGRFESKTAY